jgi:hypothetical protein
MIAKQSKPIEREWIGVAEAEILTGRSRWTWRRDAYAGRVGSAKIGRRLLLRLAEVRQIMDAGYRPALPADLPAPIEPNRRCRVPETNQYSWEQA